MRTAVIEELCHRDDLRVYRTFDERHHGIDQRLRADLEQRVRACLVFDGFLILIKTRRHLVEDVGMGDKVIVDDLLDLCPAIERRKRLGNRQTSRNQHGRRPGAPAQNNATPPTANLSVVFTSMKASPIVSLLDDL